MTLSLFVAISVIVLCLSIVWQLAQERFRLAVRLDGRLLTSISHLPTWWNGILLPISRLLRPRNLGIILVGWLAWELAANHTKRALFIALIVAGMMGMELLKQMFKRPRPLNEFIHVHKIKSLSFPSGHAASGLLFFLGAISLLTPPIWLTLLLAGVGLLIGFSRIYLRVHHPSDVLAGWLLAVAWWQAVLILLGGHYSL